MGLNGVFGGTQSPFLILSIFGLLFWTWFTYQGILSNERRETSLKAREKDLNARASALDSRRADLDRRADSQIEERRALEVMARNLNRRNAPVARFTPPASDRVAPPAKPKPVPPSVYDRLIADDEFTNEGTGHPEGS